MCIDIVDNKTIKENKERKGCIVKIEDNEIHAVGDKKGGLMRGEREPFRDRGQWEANIRE